VKDVEEPTFIVGIGLMRFTKKDREVVKLSLQKSGCGIKYVDETLRADRAINFIS
jgi:hypothetical protein